MKNIKYIKSLVLLFLFLWSCSQTTEKPEKDLTILPKDTIDLGLKPDYHLNKDYSKVNLLGNGSFGSVYSAKFKTTKYKNKQIAVKIYKESNGQSPWDQAYSEYNMLKKCSHPNIPEAYERVYDKILMQYIPSKTLEEYRNDNEDKLKEQSSKQNIESFLDKWLKLLKIVQYLQEYPKIAHLDIAVQNVMVNGNYNKENLYLIDFGKAEDASTPIHKNIDVQNSFETIYKLFIVDQNDLLKENTRFKDVLDILEMMLSQKKYNFHLKPLKGLTRDEIITAMAKVSAINKHKIVPVGYSLIDINALIEDIRLMQKEFVTEETESSFQKYYFYREARNFCSAHKVDFSKYEKYR